MKANETWGPTPVTGSVSLSRRIRVAIDPSLLVGLLALIVWCGMRSEPTSAAAQAAPIYEIAFASFGPINADMFIADADGHNANRCCRTRIRR